MRIKFKTLMVIVVATFFFSGCVLKTTYDSALQENQKLSQDLGKTKSSLSELQGQHDKLAEVNTQQGKDLQGLQTKLDEALKPETLLKALAAFIAGQQAKIDTLLTDNASLKAAASAVPAAVDESVPAVVAPAAVAEPTPTAEVMAESPEVASKVQEPVAETIEAAPVVENAPVAPVTPAVEVPASEATVLPEPKTAPAN